MSKITYSYGKPEDFEDIVRLCGTWWYDSSFYKETGMEYRPDLQSFYNQYEANKLLTVVGRDSLGTVVAAYVASIDQYLFNMEYTMASEIVWCLHKDYREGREVFGLLDAIDLANTSSGINMYNLNLPIQEGKAKLAEYLVRKRGFFTQDMCVMKEIKYG